MSSWTSASRALSAVVSSSADPGAPAGASRLLGAHRAELHPRSRRNRRALEQLLRHRLDILAGRARGLAAILEETRRPAEAVAARHLAELAEAIRDNLAAELVPALPADWRDADTPTSG